MLIDTLYTGDTFETERGYMRALCTMHVAVIVVHTPIAGLDYFYPRIVANGVVLNHAIGGGTFNTADDARKTAAALWSLSRRQYVPDAPPFDSALFNEYTLTD